jgi:hypothetical protein
LSKPDFSDPKSHSSEEPHIQREIDSDKTGMIRRYLRLADNLLRSRTDEPSSSSSSSSGAAGSSSSSPSPPSSTSTAA